MDNVNSEKRKVQEAAEAAKGTLIAAKNKASEVAEQGQHKAEELLKKAQHEAEELAQAAKNKASELKNRAEHKLAEEKNEGGLLDKLHDSAEKVLKKDLNGDGKIG